MGIKFYEKERIFKIDTLNTSYILGIFDDEGFLGHAYYGARLDEYDLRYMFRMEDYPFVPSKNYRDRVSFLDVFPNEFSMCGVGDFRESSIDIKNCNGTNALYLTYKSHEIFRGKKILPNLPATFDNDGNVSTLEVTLQDKVTNIEVVLCYSVFDDCDVIVRSARVNNCSDYDIYINKIMSMCMDMDNCNYDVISLHGSWARERHIQRSRVGYGKFRVASNRGKSSHQNNPFIALISSNGDYDNGEVYGFNFVYSGNFLAQVEQNQFDNLRIVMGINDENFSFKLTKNDTFVTPEVVMVYSNAGLNQMSQRYHDVYRKHLIRGKYKDIRRPILINNWEATYFDFDSDKLIDIAKESAKLGIEMLVMDDGWFGKRNTDNLSLGDWFVNEDKLKGGLKKLVDSVNELGMKFGIWFEPEMVSPNSDLFREHPDYAIQIPNRDPSRSRDQLVLDLSRKEVRDYVYEMLKNVLNSANIEYVKWDMNRDLTDLYSSELDYESMGELSHRYMMGVYDLQERLITDFPNLLLENCSSGGARFDPGMLYYSPQIWCSDDIDPVERLMIHEGTALIYPLSCIGAHVGASPNHSCGRDTSFDLRGLVAMCGTFGYELDVTKLSDEDKKKIPEQIEEFKKINELIRMGDYIRIASYLDNKVYDCMQVVSKDKKESVVFYVKVKNSPSQRSKRIKLKGLLKNEMYYLEDSTCYRGEVLMNVGLPIENLWGDNQGKIFVLKTK